jgi:hypothetical protein
MDLPSHPDTDDTDAPPPATGANWPVRALVGLIGLIVAVIILLHITGVVGPLGR